MPSPEHATPNSRSAMPLLLDPKLTQLLLLSSLFDSFLANENDELENEM